MSLRRDLLLVSLLFLHDSTMNGVAQGSVITVTSPQSGDIFQAGDNVRVEWEAPVDSSYFDISLLNDGIPVGDPFCAGGCLAPSGFLVVVLPTGLESSSMYSFLVSDRVEEVSNYGESEAFEIVATTAGVLSDTSTDEDGDGDKLSSGIVIAGVAAGLGLALLCVFVFCCRKHRHGRSKNKAPAKTQGGGSDARHGGGDGKVTDICGDVCVSSGGGSNAGTSISGLAGIGALCPSYEENAEIVTTNPMISAMVKGAQFCSTGGGSVQFHSTGGAGAKFHSTGGSSKFPSLGGASSTRGGGDDEEAGSMFADADVVAQLAAAAAKDAGKQDGHSTKRPGSGRARSDGSWIKSASRSIPEPATQTVARQRSSGFMVASEAERKSAEAGGDPEPEAAGPKPVPAMDWMVSTRHSFDTKKAPEGPVFLARVKSDASNIAATREEKVESSGASVEAGAMMEETEVEKPEDATATVNAAPTIGETHAFSPQLVDGISAKAFEQAKVVASELPLVKRQGQGVVSEPECEVPTPALRAGWQGTPRKHDDYSWLFPLSLSAGCMENSGQNRPSGDLPVKPSDAKTAMPESQVGRNALAQKATPASLQSPSAIAAKGSGALPVKPTEDEAAVPAAPKLAGVLGQAVSRPEQRETSMLRLPPKAQGVTPRRSLPTPLVAGSTSLNSTTAVVKSPRGPRVSQFVEVFEGLTPRGKTGLSFGMSSPGKSKSFPTSSAVAPGTPKAGPPKTGSPSFTEIPKSAPAVVPSSPGGVMSVREPTGGASTVLTTPVATPDGAYVAATNATKGATSTAPKELLRARTPTIEARTTWSTPTASPDRTPRVVAPNSRHMGGTPEYTTPYASKSERTEGSPIDEGQFAWQLESPAGVDGLPSPIGSSDIHMLTAKKGGRIIPAILGASNTPVTENTPVLTPGTVDIKALSGSAVSSRSSSIGAGWEMGSGSSFGASQVAAFVADAQAEAAAEAAHEQANQELAREGDTLAEATQAKDEVVRSTASPGVGEGAATSPEPSLTAEQQNVGEGADNELEARPIVEASEEEASTPIVATSAQASKALFAAMAAAKAASEGDASAEDTPSKTAETTKQAEQAAHEAAAASAAKTGDAKKAARVVSESSSVANTNEVTAAAPNVMAARETTEAVAAPDGGRSGIISHADAVVSFPEVYNDADTDADPDPEEICIDAGLEIDAGDVVHASGEKNRGTAKSSILTTPNVASIGGLLSATPTTNDQEEPAQKLGVGDKGELIQQQDYGSLLEETPGTDALVTNAMALADAAESDAKGLYRSAGYGFWGGKGEEIGEHVDASTAPAISRVYSSVSSRSEMFRSSKSILSWSENDEEEEGDAERQAEEVQALVAEALALVKEAGQDC